MRTAARRLFSVIAAWYALGGFGIAAVLSGTWVTPWFTVAGIAVGVSGLAAAVGLWQDLPWAGLAITGLGVAGAAFPIVGMAAARNCTQDAVVAATIGGGIFLGVCLLVARRLKQPARPERSRTSVTD